MGMAPDTRSELRVSCSHDWMPRLEEWVLNTWVAYNPKLEDEILPQTEDLVREAGQSELLSRFQDFLDHLAVNVRQAEVSPLKLIRQFRVIDHRGSVRIVACTSWTCTGLLRML